MRFDDAARLGNREDDVGPAGELAAIFEGKVEQRGQHAGGQFDRNGLDPVEGLTFGKRLQDIDRALADQRLDVLQVLRLDRWGDRLALRSLHGRIHGDE